ncbi:MAG: hypothetical protein ACK56F_31885, partial [bacterium]
LHTISCTILPLPTGTSQKRKLLETVHSAAPTPCQYTLKVILNSGTTFFEPACFESCLSTFTPISGCFQPGQAKVSPGPTPLTKSLYRGGSQKVESVNPAQLS